MGTTLGDATCVADEVFYVGSDDEDYDSPETRTERFETAGQRFLDGWTPFILTATLKGPFENTSGWVNPWRSKLRTAGCLEPSAKATKVETKASRKRKTSIPETVHDDVQDSLECHLPSPESLKQPSVAEAHPYLEDEELAMVQKWRNSVHPSVLERDSFWASTPSERNSAVKRKAKGSGWLKTLASKRQRTSRLGSSPVSSPIPVQFGKAKLQKTTTTSTAPPDDSFRSLPEPQSSLTTEPAEAEEHAHYQPNSQTIDKKSKHKTTTAKNAAMKACATLSSPVSLRRVASSSTANTPGPTDIEQGSQSLELSKDFETQNDESFRFKVRAINNVQEEQPDLTSKENATPIAANSSATETEAWSGLSSPPHSNRGSHLKDEQPEASHLDDDIGNDPMREDAATTSSEISDLCSEEFEGFEGVEHLLTGVSDAHLMSEADTANTSSSDGDENMIEAVSDTLSEATEDESDEEPEDFTHEMISITPNRSNVDDTGPVLQDSPDHTQGLCEDPPRVSQSDDSKELSIGDEPEPSLSAPVTESATDPSDQPSGLGGGHFLPPESVSRVINAMSKTTTSSILPAQDRPSLSTACAGGEDGQGADATTHSVNIVPAQDLESPLPISQQSPWVESRLSQNLAPSVSHHTEWDGQASTPQTNNNPPAVTSPDSMTIWASETKQPQSTSEAQTPNDRRMSPLQELSANAVAHVGDKLALCQPTVTSAPAVRPSTPEPQFSVKSFASFMSPSPERRPRLSERGCAVFRGSGARLPSTQGILASATRNSWRTGSSNRRVSWAALPNEEAAQSPSLLPGDETVESVSPHDNGRACRLSPPPAMPVAELPTSDDAKFHDHFTAMARRAGVPRQQILLPASQRTVASPDPRAMAETFVNADDVKKPRVSFADHDVGKMNDGEWTREGHHEPQDSGANAKEPMDIVEDVFREMGDMLNAWDVDAELNEARKSEACEHQPIRALSQSPW